MEVLQENIISAMVRLWKIGSLVVEFYSIIAVITQ